MSLLTLSLSKLSFMHSRDCLYSKSSSIIPFLSIPEKLETCLKAKIKSFIKRIAKLAVISNHKLRLELCTPTLLHKVISSQEKIDPKVDQRFLANKIKARNKLSTTFFIRMAQGQLYLRNVQAKCRQMHEICMDIRHLVLTLLISTFCQLHKSRARFLVLPRARERLESDSPTNKSIFFYF